MFFKARANTKVIEGVEDIEGWDDVKEEDKEPILKFIDELNELRANKGEGGAKRTPKKKADDTASPEKVSGLHLNSPQFSAKDCSTSKTANFSLKISPFFSNQSTAATICLEYCKVVIFCDVVMKKV
ncbi:hypothetical protein OSTOST_21422 [Ostertagia ostertagi]